MATEPTYRKDQKVVLDPVSGKPLVDLVLPSVIVGNEVEPIEMDDEISGPDDDFEATSRPRSNAGTQLIIHIDEDTDPLEVARKLREEWQKSRG